VLKKNKQNQEIALNSALIMVLVPGKIRSLSGRDLLQDPENSAATPLINTAK
jgi:hypothetical protein